MRRCGHRDDKWERICGLLLGQQGHATATDNRLFVEAVLHRYRAGVPWRDLPERLEAWKNVHTWFSCWFKAGIWERVFLHLAADADNEHAMTDGTVVRAHQHSASAQKKLGRTAPARIRRSGAPAAA